MLYEVITRLGDTLADYSCDSMGRDMIEESAKILEDLGEKYLYVYVLISLGVRETLVYLRIMYAIRSYYALRLRCRPASRTHPGPGLPNHS